MVRDSVGMIVVQACPVAVHLVAVRVAKADKAGRVARADRADRVRVSPPAAKVRVVARRASAERSTRKR